MTGGESGPLVSENHRVTDAAFSTSAREEPISLVVELLQLRVDDGPEQLLLVGHAL
jgi:hypothetical protein